MDNTARLSADARVCFVSDLHIGDGSPTESFGRKDDLLRRFFEDEACRADAFVIVGDGFDLAQAWTPGRVEEGHPRLIEDLRQLARAMPVYYLRGNHEGSGRALADFLPLRYYDNLAIGDRVLVEHGNVFDDFHQPGDRRAFWAVRTHALIEKVVRSPVRIPMRKHYYWSTRLGHWLFFRYGQLQRELAHVYESRGHTAKAERCWKFLDYWGRGEWGDAAGLLRAAETVLGNPDVDVLVCGHSHQPGRLELPGGTYVNTGSWTFDDATFARYDDGRFVVQQYPDGRELTDEEYLGVLGPHRDKSFFDWWEAFYRGWLRYDVPEMQRAAMGLSSGTCPLEASAIT